MKTTIRPLTKPRSRGANRLAIGIIALGSGLGLLLTPLGAGGQAADQSSVVASQITIVQTPTDPQPEIDCVPAALAVLNGALVPQPFGDSTIFKLTIHATTPLCEPLSVKAVVYAMPGNLSAPWPQTLKEVKTFSISQQGDTVVTFAKGCDPVQFDVITGDTPPVINSGLEHGPLLFPGNLETAYQHPGNTTPDCVGDATTSTSTPGVTSTTTTTAVVKATTTIKDPSTTAKVLSVTTIPSNSNTGTSSGTSASGLAVTGATSRPFALIGGGLVLIGLAAILASRRRFV